MKRRGFYVYIRTSTVKQGIEGVSLEVQREQACNLARQKGVEVTKVFSEMETAAKQGRPVFTQMMKELRAGVAEGLILHKIDRGARNLREWSDITDLIELGVKVYFVHDSIDLNTRGGRLTGDMLAAVAADYVRNLREETKKGLVGRLKQGIWPFSAPLGYVNNGGGKPKTIDPLRGLLVRQAFELYATGKYTIKSLRLKLHDLGLRTSSGKPLSKQSLTCVFHNRFYYGSLQLRSTGEQFPGVHQPLISKVLFDNVQTVLDGRIWRKASRHNFLYRGDITCALCSYRLVGEKQKSHVYYRCHSKQCAGTSFREERVTASMERDLKLLLRFVETYPGLEAALRVAIARRKKESANAHQVLLLRRSKIEDRFSALMDAFIDGVLDKEAYILKKNELLNSKADVSQLIEQSERGELPVATYAEYYLELAIQLRRMAFLNSPSDARQLSRCVTSNFHAKGKTVALQWESRFEHVLDQAKLITSAHPRTEPRTIEYFTKLLMGDIDVTRQ
ncbi:recombinase family protein [Rhodoferax sp. GW822-FHT02A01]|uniref:recombinase family protein n=1 Tax=Rhodoferax sp. GW822-FHT02A01 TaxID=3141537 RepID=UPI00315DF899